MDIFIWSFGISLIVTLILRSVTSKMPQPKGAFFYGVGIVSVFFIMVMLLGSK